MNTEIGDNFLNDYFKDIIKNYMLPIFVLHWLLVWA